MKKLLLVPDGWSCTLNECPPGLFIYKGSVCFKTEYSSSESIDAYCDSGETFVAGCTSVEERGRLIVQPILPEWNIDDVYIEDKSCL